MKELKVPDEMKDLMLDWLVCSRCRNEAIVSVFRAKRAIYYGKQAEKANIKFWKLVKELHPETITGNWTYSFKKEALINEAQHKENL